MDLRESFSKLRKKSKHLPTGSKRKSDRMGADADRERVDSAGSLLRPDPRVVAGGGRDREGNGANAVGRQIYSTDRPPQPDEPEPVPARGGGNDQGGGEADIDGREVNQTYFGCYL
jgi:hypothetical protein